MDADHGDVDGDGDIDLVLAQEFATNIILINDGAGSFSVAAGAVGGGRGDNEDVRLRDFDNDGDLDMLTVHEDDRVHALLFNDGVGNFTDMSSLIPIMSTANAAEVVDLDSDGLLDIILGNQEPNIVLLQQVNGSFVDDSANRPLNSGGTTQDLLLLDIDGDTDLDLFVADETANNLYVNDGNGFFADESAARLPMGSRETREADAADVDNDGDLDIVVANVSFINNTSVANQLLLNNGTGEFTDASATALSNVANTSNSFTVKFVDLDSDGDMDVLAAANSLSQGGAVDVWINDGNGTFSSPATSPFSSLPAGSVFDIEVVDVNSDGLDDIYFCHRTGTDQLYFGR